MSAPAGLVARLRARWPEHKGRISASGIATLTLGLAPYYPHAHVWKQLENIWNGTFTEPLDQLDLVLHGAPWVALFFFAGRWLVDAARAPALAAPRKT